MGFECILVVLAICLVIHMIYSSFIRKKRFREKYKEQIEELKRRDNEPTKTEKEPGTKGMTKPERTGIVETTKPERAGIMEKTENTEGTKKVESIPKSRRNSEYIEEDEDCKRTFMEYWDCDSFQGFSHGYMYELKDGADIKKAVKKIRDSILESDRYKSFVKSFNKRITLSIMLFPEIDGERIKNFIKDEKELVDQCREEEIHLLCGAWMVYYDLYDDTFNELDIETYAGSADDAATIGYVKRKITGHGGFYAERKNERTENQDYKQAFDWYVKAAGEGNKYAMKQLGLFYENGYGVEQDIEKASYWYQKARE